MKNTMNAFDCFGRQAGFISVNGYRDEAIGRLYGRCRSSINNRRNVALKQLQKEWERLEHEEQKANTF